MLVVLLRKQIKTLKLQQLKINLIIIIMINILLLPEFNTLAAGVFNARLAQANLVTKTNFNNTASSLNSKIAANKTKIESIENEIKKLKRLDLSYFIGKSHFEDCHTKLFSISTIKQIFQSDR